MELETPYIHLRVKDNILIGTYKENLHIDLVIAKEIVRTRLSFTGGRKLPALILSEGVISMDKPARDYLASDEAIKDLLAAAIFVNSSFSSLLGNFFLKVNKTKMPVRVFHNISRAERWLAKYVELKINCNHG
ncbi:MAG: hypothetical protein ABIN01_22435 [Ferruginibacter sp.]